MLSLNFNPFPILTTNRLVLREMDLADDKDIFTHRNDELVNTHLESFRHTSITETQAFITRVLNEIRANKTILWVVCRPDDITFMGTVCLWNISKEEEKAELGYTLCSEHHHKGYMTEAVKKAMDFGFNNMHLKTIEAFTHKNNVASIKLLESNGFKPKSIQHVEGKKDRVVFSISK